PGGDRPSRRPAAVRQHRGGLSGGHLLIALGGTFLVAGLMARFGRRLGLPTIPLFMAAGLLLGPPTPGFVLIDAPSELGVLAALGLVLLLFHLGLEFSLDDLIGGGRSLLAAGATTSRSTSPAAWPSGSCSAGAPGRRSSSPASWASRRRPSPRS